MAVPAPSSEAALAVELRGIAKRFPGVVANEDVNLAVRAGEVHAIVGENGAGKSTLMKILYGMQRPDEGTVRVNGEDVVFRSPKDAIAAGIGMVHQHFMLAGNLTVLENVVLGHEPRRRRVSLDFVEARRRIRALLRREGADFDPDRLVEDLSVGEKQRVEIVKVLYRGARILILDEPTGVLVPQEVEELFASLRGLTAEGVTVLFISHKLGEVLEIADRITVMRGGRTVSTVDADEIDTRELAELMVGSELPTPETREATVTDVVVLEVEGLGMRAAAGPGPMAFANAQQSLGSLAGGEAPVEAALEGRWLLRDVSFRIHRGEVVGIAGVEGNGQRELVEALLGLHPPTAGSARLDGEDITGWSTRRRRAAGIGYIPEDRQERGLVLGFPLWENAMLGHQHRAPFARGPWIRPDAARARTAEIIRQFHVLTPSVSVPAHALSGGNQQRLIVGRELVAEPRVLIAAHPTRGIDVGAQASVWEEIRNARGAGMAILVISADLEELIGLSDRLLVMYGGRLVAELDPATVTPQQLGVHMTGGTPDDEAGSGNGAL